MKNKIQNLQLSQTNLDDLRDRISTGDGFRMLSQKELPDFIPESLRQKIDSATQIVSGSNMDKACIMFNLRRIDKQEVDEHPFGLVAVSGSVPTSGAFLEHGDWIGRTSPLPTEFQSHITSSGIGNYFLSNPPSGKVSGSLDELGPSDSAAFEKFIAKIGH